MEDPKNDGMAVPFTPDRCYGAAPRPFASAHIAVSTIHAGFQELMDQANAVLAEMVEEGAITAEERARMVLGGHLRRKSELLVPFAREGQFQRLVVKECEITVLPDAAWAYYQKDGNKEALATKRALFFQSVFMRSLAAALTRVRAGDDEALRSFANRLQVGLTRRLTKQPAPIDSFVETIVLARCV